MKFERVSLDVQILEHEDQLEPLRAQWDELAVRLAHPFAAPGWMLAWWRYAAPPNASLRAFAVRDGERLLGIAPLWVADAAPRSAHYDVLSARLSPPAPVLVGAERSAEVAAALAERLAKARPRPALIRLEGRRATHARVTRRILDAWPGPRPRVHRAEATAIPMVHLGGRSYDEWIATKRGKFRQEARRRRRRLEESGASFELAGIGDLDRVLDAYFELHASYWERRGGSSLMLPGVREMLVSAARELLPQGRLRVYYLEREERVIAVQILAAAGEEVAGWSGGFDQGEKALAPSLQLILQAIADAARRGESRVNLGPGAQPYKLPLADDQDELRVLKLVPHGLAYPRTMLRLGLEQARARRTRS